MADVSTVRGVLVGCERVPYQNFTDRETGEVRPAGFTLWVWIAPADGVGGPTRVKCKLDDFAMVSGWGAGSAVEVTYTLLARRDVIVRQLLSADLLDGEAATG